MGEDDAASIYRELGGTKAKLEDVYRRLHDLEQRQDKHEEIISDVKHIRNNIAMMKKPVEEYEKFKQRGIGGWLTICGIFGGISTLCSVAAYVIRAYVLGIGTP